MGPAPSWTPALAGEACGPGSWMGWGPGPAQPRWGEREILMAMTGVRLA